MITLPLGQIVATPNALNQILPQDLKNGLARHQKCDWGDLSPHDKKANDFALADGERILSAYKSASGQTFWIITEWDRSVTTILMPEDY